MQVLINIPNWLYHAIQEHKEPIYSQSLGEAVRDGIPLPNGHGRLIEVNKLLNMTKSYKSELGRLKADPFVKSGIETVESFIKEIPTIIEADRSEEE